MYKGNPEDGTKDPNANNEESIPSENSRENQAEPMEAERNMENGPLKPQYPAYRNKTAFALFQDEQRVRLQKENPGLGAALIARKMGLEWKALPESTKKVSLGSK